MIPPGPAALSGAGILERMVWMPGAEVGDTAHTSIENLFYLAR